MALAGCVQSSSGGSTGGSTSAKGSGASKHLTVFISADTNIQDLWQKTLIPAFEKANPKYTVNVDFDLHGLHDQQTIAKLTAATVQKKDPGYDLVDAGFISQIAASGLLTKVDTSKVPELKDVPKATLKAGGDGGIPYRASSVLLAYDKNTVSTPPKTLDDLLAWIKANPGKFAYNSPESGGSGQSFVTTVLDKYLSTSERQKMETSYVPDLESKWDQGFATLASLNPYVFQKGVYPNGNNQVLDLLSSGQISMAPVWSDQFITGQKNGQIPANIAYTQITNPSLTGGAAYLGIPKASPRQKAAFTLVSWLLQPKAQELVSNEVAGYPVISLDKLPASVQQKFKNADIEHLRPPYFASMASDMNKAWSEKVPGK
jgi:putative spermidine/putrescine transport system substrate-binding protein